MEIVLNEKRRSLQTVYDLEPGTAFVFGGNLYLRVGESAACRAPAVGYTYVVRLKTGLLESMSNKTDVQLTAECKIVASYEKLSY